MRRQVADHLVVVMKRSNVRGAKGVGHPRWNHNAPDNRDTGRAYVRGVCRRIAAYTFRRGDEGTIPTCLGRFRLPV
jgi:hypothetical protein